MATHKPVYIDELYGSLEYKDNDICKWFVIKTKYQSEKKLAQWAKDNDIEYYLPQYSKKKKYQNRLIETTKPLFSGYIFIKMDYDKKTTILRPGYVVSVINVKHQDILLEELKRFYFLKSEGYKLLPGDKLAKGNKVKVTNGPLKGTYGFVLEGDNPNKIIITANVINQAVEVTLKHENLQKVEE